MAAGGPHNPPVYHNGRWSNFVNVARHTYGYWVARCSRCGGASNWASEQDAKAWAGDHERGHD